MVGQTPWSARHALVPPPEPPHEPADGGTGRGPRGLRHNFTAAHTTPQRRRSSHSAARIARTSRKSAGISHRSRVSRVVMPASEYEISFASLDVSEGL